MYIHKYKLTNEQLCKMDAENISRQLVAVRCTKLGMTIEEAVNKPKQIQRKTTSDERELMRKNNISSSLLSKRLSRGMSRYQALNTVNRGKRNG